MQGKKGIVVYPCPICGSKFTHVFKKNSLLKYCGKLLNCEIYGKLFNPKQALVGHHNVKHVEKFICDLCGKCCKNVSKFDRHKMTHNVEKSFTFPKCGKKFVQKDNKKQLKISTKSIQILLQHILVIFTNCSIVIYH